MILNKIENNLLTELNLDDPLPNKFKHMCDHWLSSLALLKDIKVARNFYPLSFIPMSQELHVFSYASDQAIGHVTYLWSIASDSKVHVAFISSASMVAPKSALGTPRALCCGRRGKGRICHHPRTGQKAQCRLS